MGTQLWVSDKSSISPKDGEGPGSREYRMSAERARDAQSGAEKTENFRKAFLRWFFMWKLGGRYWHTTRQSISIDRKTFTIDGLLQEMVSLSPSGMFRQVLEASIRMVGLDDLESLGQL